MRISNVRMHVHRVGGFGFSFGCTFLDKVIGAGLYTFRIKREKVAELLFKLLKSKILRFLQMTFECLRSNLSFCSGG